MLSVSLDALELESYRASKDAAIAHRGSWVTWADEGTDAAVTYFEIAPGHHLGRHTHDFEETVLILTGRARASIGDEDAVVTGPHLIVMPEGEVHDLENLGSETLRAIGLFPSPSVTTRFETELEPAGSRELGSPDRTRD